MAKASHTPVQCDRCGKTINRASDLPRHAKTHLANKAELMLPCTYPGCTYRALQRSNLLTHMNVHTGEKPNKCPMEGCEFRTSDPGSLTRHRKAKHGHKTANSRSNPSPVSLKEARQQRRAKPYPTPSSSISPSSSTSPLDRSPRPQLPEILDLTPALTLGQAAKNAKNGSKNETAAYLTKVTDELNQSGSSTSNPNPEPENTAPSSTLLMAPEAPRMDLPQLPMPEQGDFYAVARPALPISETTAYPLSDPQIESFLAQLDDYSPAPAPVPDSLSALLDPYYLPDASLYNNPTPLYGNDYSNLASVPLPTVPQLDVENIPGYEAFDYPTGGATFEDQFLSTYPYDPHTDIYPGVVNAPYDAYHTSTTGFTGYYGY